MQRQRKDLQTQHNGLSRGEHAGQGPAAENAELGDLRFRSLLGSEAWERLPPAVRRRFSKRVSNGATIVYKGRVTSICFSRLGWVLAQALRAAGAPLPISRAVGLPSVVTVTEDLRSRGQFWTRLYVRDNGFPQVVHSVKRFSGPTGLEEAIGAGLIMALELSVEDGALVFRSAGYALQIGAVRLPLPAVLMPGRLTVRHEDIDARSFRFSLTLAHRFFGTLVHQECVYTEEKST